MLPEFERESHRLELKLNTTKAKVMTNVDDAIQIALETNVLESMEKCEFDRDNSTTEVSR